MVLTPEEIEEIQAEILHAPYKQSASIEALKIAQLHRGWISDDVLREVAFLVDMTADELDGVASFYSNIYRKPVGRHVIRVCNTATCWIMESESILEFLNHRLGIEPGETTSDGRFTLLSHVCMGFCDHAPAMMIDDDIYGDLDPEQIEEIFKTYL